MGHIFKTKEVDKVKSLVLITLGKYKFLTRKQLGRLKVARTNSMLTDACVPLAEAGYIGVETTASHGHVQFLLKKGALKLADGDEEAFNDISYLMRPPELMTYKWPHKIATISLQIELDLWAERRGLEVGLYIRDIESKGSIKKHGDLRKATRVDLQGRWFEPDGIFLVDGKLYTLEYENFTFVKNSLKKFDKHCEALLAKAVGKQLGLYSDKGDQHKVHRSLWVFQDESIMRNVMKEINKTADPMFTQGKWFLFKTEKEILCTLDPRFKVTSENDYFENWLTLGGERVNMLD